MKVRKGICNDIFWAGNVKNFKIEGRENLNPMNLTIVEKVSGFRKKCFEWRIVRNNSKVVSEKDVLEVFAGNYNS